MRNDGKNYLWLNYSHKFGDDKTVLSIHYCSKDLFTHDERSKYVKAFKDYISTEYDYTVNDVVDIVTKVRKITESLKESELKVSIKKENYSEYVEYKNGYLENCGVFSHVWDDEIYVTSTYNGVDIRFKKYQFSLSNQEKILEINKILEDYYNKVIELTSMIKDNNEVDNEDDCNKIYQKV